MQKITFSSHLTPVARYITEVDMEIARQKSAPSGPSQQLGRSEVRVVFAGCLVFWHKKGLSVFLFVCGFCIMVGGCVSHGLYHDHFVLTVFVMDLLMFSWRSSNTVDVVRHGDLLGSSDFGVFFLTCVILCWTILTGLMAALQDVYRAVDGRKGSLWENFEFFFGFLFAIWDLAFDSHVAYIPWSMSSRLNGFVDFLQQCLIWGCQTARLEFSWICSQHSA